MRDNGLRTWSTCYGNTKTIHVKLKSFLGKKPSLKTVKTKSQSSKKPSLKTVKNSTKGITLSTVTLQARLHY